MTTLSFTKGHGTHNDFVLLADTGNELDLSAELVAKLSDRRGGIGADGVIRVVLTKDVAEGRHLLDQDPRAQWFMDYRNADGSIAQMCGNGVRVFAAFLEELDLVDFSDGAQITIGTRAGLRTVHKEGDWYCVGMGEYAFPYAEQVLTAGADSTVHIQGIAGVGVDDIRPALSVDMGNPHTVVAVASEAELQRIDFMSAPEVNPVPENGTNVEAVVPLPNTQLADGTIAGHLAMRVHERGVGETQSCGTGACAAALAVRLWTSQAAVSGTVVPDVWLVDIPGGQVRVSVNGADVELAGPAVLIASGTVNTDAL